MEKNWMQTIKHWGFRIRLLWIWLKATLRASEGEEPTVTHPVHPHVCPVALWIQTIAKNSANKEEETLTLSQKCRQLHFLLRCNNKQFKYFLKIHISIITICPKRSFICWWHTYLQHILECVSYLVGIWKKWCIFIFREGRLKSMHYILNILNVFSFFQLMKELVCVKWD